MSELTRANKVTVKVDENDKYVADFYRTHKHILTVNESETGFERKDGLAKNSERELFRIYMIDSANSFGIEWNPADLRSAENIRKAQYVTDDDLIEDATSMIINPIKDLVAKCKYPVEWAGITFDNLEALKKTGKGTDLAGLGIVDGKYKNSGHWAWAKLDFILTTKFKGEEVYCTITTELISGQLKKPNVGITALNELIKNSIINDGLATADELDPPKVKEHKVTKEETPAEEPKVEIPKKEEKTPKADKSAKEETPEGKRTRKANATK